MRQYNLLIAFTVNRISGNMEIEEDTNLRYMQIHISIDSGRNLPGSKLINFFSSVEFLSTIEKKSNGLICYALLKFDNLDALSNAYEGLEIIKILSKIIVLH